MNPTKLTQTEIRNRLWRAGELSWKLHDGQKSLYELFHNGKHKKQVWLLARRFGKSYALVVLALEQCIKFPKSIVKIASPTKDQVEKNLRPLFRDILMDCPDDVSPEWKKKESIYFFPNGSEIQLAGTDKGNSEKLRGGNCNIAMVDEAGSCSDLHNLITNILMPTTLKTQGKIILASTPPSEMDHEFLDFIEEAQNRGTLIKKTIYENPTLSKQTIDEAIEEIGGIDSTACKREYFCEIIKDSVRTVLPEATEELMKEIVKEWPKPPYFDAYVGMDIGLNDLTVVLFGYYDFRADKVIIQDEFAIEGKDLHLSKLGFNIIEKEKELWTNPLTYEVRTPYMRISDTNLVAMNEIAKATHNKVIFIGAKKDDNDAALNLLRMMLSNKKIIISPKCKILIRHLLNVKWAANKKTFARSPDDGHYDAVDAIKYMIRSIVYSKNPYPSHYNLDVKDLFVTNKEKFQSNDQLSVYKKIFGRK